MVSTVNKNLGEKVAESDSLPNSPVWDAPAVTPPEDAAYEEAAIQRQNDAESRRISALVAEEYSIVSRVGADENWRNACLLCGDAMLSPDWWTSELYYHTYMMLLLAHQQQNPQGWLRQLVTDGKRYIAVDQAIGHYRAVKQLNALLKARWLKNARVPSSQALQKLRTVAPDAKTGADVLEHLQAD